MTLDVKLRANISRSKHTNAKRKEPRLESRRGHLRAKWEGLCRGRSSALPGAMSSLRPDTLGTSQRTVNVLTVRKTC